MTRFSKPTQLAIVSSKRYVEKKNKVREEIMRLLKENNLTIEEVFPVEDKFYIDVEEFIDDSFITKTLVF